MLRIIMGLIVGVIAFLAVRVSGEHVKAKLALYIYVFGLLVALLGLALNEWRLDTMLQQPYYGLVVGFCASFATAALLVLGLRRK